MPRRKKNHLEYSPPAEMIHKDWWEVRRQQNAAAMRRATSSENNNIDVALVNEIIVPNENNERTEMEEQEM